MPDAFTPGWVTVHTMLVEPPWAIREAEILRMVVRGLSNGEVATQLYIAEATVETHVS